VGQNIYGFAGWFGGRNFVDYFEAVPADGLVGFDIQLCYLTGLDKSALCPLAWFQRGETKPQAIQCPTQVDRGWPGLE